MAYADPTPPTRSGFFFSTNRKRFQNPSASADTVLHIDRTGTMLDPTPAARALLEYGQEQPMERCFFSLVHSKNQYQVMRDVADMIVHGKRNANWFLRLRTGRQRWQWFQARASSSDAPEGAIVIHLSQARAV